MSLAAGAVNQSNAFMRKHEKVELFGHPRHAERATIPIQELEAMRTSDAPISASKHGLETICGASCETGAQ